MNGASCTVVGSEFTCSCAGDWEGKTCDEPKLEMTGINSWLLLGPKIEPNPAGLRGLAMTTYEATTLSKGPFGLIAWDFTGNNYVKITNDGSLNLEKDSFTIATFVYQDVLKNGPIVEWGGTGSVGTHMWIYQSKLFTNLDAVSGRSATSFHVAPPTGKWSFVGISFDHTTGYLLMWVDDNVLDKNVGSLGLSDMVGDLYIVRPASTGYKFTGKLAGTTLLSRAITQDQIPTLMVYDKDTSTPSMGSCNTLPCRNGATCTPNGNDFSCTCSLDWEGKTCETPILGMTGVKSWVLLGPKIEPNPAGLHGLTMTTYETTTLSRGPFGLIAWDFTGNNYVKITNDGSLNLEKDSFTIATFVYQDVLKNGPIVEWRGSGPYGTHMWIWGSKLFTNLDAVSGRSATSFHVAPPLGKWSFVGISFDHTTGDLLMWVDYNVLVKNVGSLGLRDMVGDLYVGVRPASTQYKLTGKLAGTTLMSRSISREQIVALRMYINVTATPRMDKITVSSDTLTVCYKYNNANCWFRDMPNMPISVSVDQCKQECAKEKDCKSFQHNGEKCWLKHHACTGIELRERGRANRNQYTKVDCTDSSQTNMDDGMFDAGGDIDVGGGINLDTNGGFRGRFGSVESSSQTNMDDGIIDTDGDKITVSSDTLTVCYKYDNANCWFRDMPNMPVSVSVDQCKQECAKEKNCKSFQHNGEKCWLKHHACTGIELRERGRANRNQYTKVDCTDSSQTNMDDGMVDAGGDIDVGGGINLNTNGGIGGRFGSVESNNNDNANENQSGEHGGGNFFDKLFG